jgi:hypothetical protein
VLVGFRESSAFRGVSTSFHGGSQVSLFHGFSRAFAGSHWFSRALRSPHRRFAASLPRVRQLTSHGSRYGSYCGEGGGALLTWVAFVGRLGYAALRRRRGFTRRHWYLTLGRLTTGQD